MRKLLLILTVFIFVNSSYAQNIIIKDYFGNDYTNSTFIHSGTLDLQEVSFTVEMAPNVVGDKILGLKRYEKMGCSNTENYFCWSLCYGAVPGGDRYFWQDDNPVTIEEDSSFSDFHAYYDHKGVGTDAEYLYVIFDTANVSDSSWVLIKFDYGQPSCDGSVGGINDNNQYKISLFPNPANNFFVVSNTSQNDVVEVLDILGKTVYSNSNASSFHQINEFNSGIYLVRVKKGNEVIFTEKLIIKK